jgi:hypothetical protein
MSLRGEPVVEEAHLADGREVRIRVAVPACPAAGDAGAPHPARGARRIAKLVRLSVAGLTIELFHLVGQY